MNASLFMDNPSWAAFLPELDSSVKKLSLPAHEDCSDIDIDKVASHLLPGGTLGQGMKGYESRPGQVQMLRAVARAYNSREHLVIEAGTGVGKSLAYLIPSIHWSYLNGTPVIISTATRNLQSQLISSDIPRALKTIDVNSGNGPFRVALLKGRGNYLCLNELNDLFHDGYYALPAPERLEMDRLVEWIQKTQSGDLDEIDLPCLRQKVTCAGDECSGRRCEFYSRCFVMRARQKASQAHLVIANHSLVLAEAGNAGTSILPAYGRIVFDEAHNLPDIATEQFSFEFSREELLRILGRIERKHGRRGTTKGVLGAVKRQLDRGALSNAVEAGRIRETLTKIRVASAMAATAGDALIDEFERFFAPDPSRTIVRFRVIEARRQYSLNSMFCDYSPAQLDEASLMSMTVAFEDKMARLVDNLMKLVELIDEANEGTLMGFFSELGAQVRNLAGALDEFVVNVKFLLSASDADYVYWAEKDRHVRLVAAPLYVGDRLNRLFYSVKDSVVLCSATLRVGDRFEYMGNKLGLQYAEADRVQSLTAESPFDYFNQSLFIALDNFPDPSSRPGDYVSSLAPFLVSLFKATEGKGLVLFTSYDMMRSVAEKSRTALAEHGITLLVQGEGLSRESMVRRLKDGYATGNPVVLFGAQSFWEGVDVSGPALSCVVMARLPFPQVGEPINEARCKRLEESGKQPFPYYMVPEAMISFRQGFGRLIRSRSDRGVVIVTDPRLATKNYGARFKKTLPTTCHIVSSPDDAISRSANFIFNV